MTQAALAERAGLATNTVGTYERGEKSPRPDTLRSLAEALGVEAANLAFGPPPTATAKPGSALADLVELLRDQDEHVVRVVADVAAVVVTGFLDREA